jgi:hypothetical protein
MNATISNVNDDINNATGYANGDLFDSEAQVREYFTPANQRDMFGHDAIVDAEQLNEWAAWVIENRSHMR